MNHKYLVEIEAARELTDTEIYNAVIVLAGYIPLSCARIKQDRIDELKKKRTNEHLDQMEYLFNKLKNVLYHLKKEANR